MRSGGVRARGDQVAARRRCDGIVLRDVRAGGQPERRTGESHGPVSHGRWVDHQTHAPGTGLSAELQDGGFGAYITSTAPIAVERSMYWNANGAVWAAG